MSGAFQLAQLNIARQKYDMESPEMADFVEALDPVNADADNSPGFVWRLDGPDDDGAEYIWGDPEWLVNVTVWQDAEALKMFIRSSRHMAVMRRRREWFEEMAEAYVALWWVPAGHRPTIAEAEERLATLRARGPTPEAFNFAKIFPPPRSGAVAS